MSFKDRQYKFSLRKFKLGLASAIVGLGLFGQVAQAEEQVSPVLSPETTSQATAQIEYVYVNYEDLTDFELACLKTEQDFHREIAQGDKTYTLVYQKEQGFLSLPKTGDSHLSLLSMLTGLGITAIFLVRDKKNRRSLKVMIVVGASAALLSGVAGYALETGIKHFLQETHQVAIGEQLPAPQSRLNGRVFRYYLADCDLEVTPNSQSGAEQLTQKETESEVVPTENGGAGGAFGAEQSSQEKAENEAVPTGTDKEETPKPVEEVNETDPKKPTEEVTESEQPVKEEKPVVDEEPVVEEKIEEKGESVTADPKPEFPINQVPTPAPTDSVNETEVPTTPKPTEPVKEVETPVTPEPTVVEKEIVTPEPAVKEPVVTESIVSIPFVNEYREDASLPLGTEVILQAGVVGQKRLVFTDGVLTSEQIIASPQNQVIVKGSYLAPVVIEPDTPVAPEPTVDVDSENPEETPQPTVPSQPSQPTIVEPEKVTTVGQEIIAFATETLDAPDLPVGTTQVVQAGQTGIVQVTYINGQAVSSQVIQAPVNEIIRVGSRQETAPEAVVEKVVREEVAFTTEYQDDASLEQGQTELVREGKNGVIERTYRNDELVSEKVISEPVSALYKRGTKTAEVIETTETVASKETVTTDEVTYIDSEDLYEGQTELVSEAVAGEKTVKTTYKVVNGKVTDEVVDVVEEITLEPQAKVVKRGTKPVAGTTTEKRQESIPFDTTIEEDDNEYEDYQAEKQAGRNGVKEITETYATEKGDKVGNPIASSETILEAPLAQIIAQGTKPIEGTETETETVALPFTTRYEDTDALYEDEEEVVIVGQTGEKLITRTYQTLKGVRQPDPIISEEVTLAAIEQVVRRGIRPIEGVVEVTTTAPVTTDDIIYVDSSDLYEGDIEVISQAAAGEKTITTTYKTIRGEQTDEGVGEPIETVTVPTKPLLVKRGTRPIEGTIDVVTTVPVTTDEVIYQDSDDLYEGQEEVVSEAVVGKKTITTTYKTIRGEQTDEVVGEPVEEITVEPQAKVVKRGTKQVSETTTEERQEVIPFQTETRNDDNQYEDFEEVIQEGRDGLKQIIETYAVENGVKVGSPISTEETVLEEPQSQIISKGTKPIQGSEVETETVALPFTTRYEDDDTLYDDEEEISTPGQDGEKVITRTYQTIKGVRQSNPTETEEITKPATEQVVRRGTRPIEGTIDVVTTVPVTTDEVIYQDSDDLYEGQEEVVSEAVAGEKTVTTTYKTIRGEQTDEVVGEPVEEITTQPQAKVVKRGTKVATEAEKQEPVGLNQSVLVNETPDATKSIEPNSVEKVASITWKEVPNTATVGTVPATVVVTYEDNSVDEIEVMLDVQALAEYYVKNGSYQSTAGNGTPEQPYDSIKQALLDATDGVVIKLVENIQGVSLPNTGSSNDFVIDKAVTIDGQGHSLSFRGLDVALQNQVTFKNITLDLLPDGVGNDSLIKANGNNVTFDQVSTTLNSQSTNYPTLLVEGGKTSFVNSLPETILKAVQVTAEGGELVLDRNVQVLEQVLLTADQTTVISSSPKVLSFVGQATGKTTVTLKDVEPFSPVTVNGITDLILDNSSITVQPDFNHLEELTLTGTSEKPAVLNLNAVNQDKVTIEQVTATNGVIRLNLSTILELNEPVTSPLTIEVNDQVERLTDEHHHQVLLTVSPDQVDDFLTINLYPENSGYRVERVGNDFVLKASQAMLNNPQEAPQTVFVGGKADAQKSVDPTSVSNVKSYTWKEGFEPDTSQVNPEAFATVLITYDDDSVDEVDVLVEVVARDDDEKTKPILTLVNLVEHDDDKAITLNYDLEDPTSAYVSAKYEIYDGDTLVKSGDISTFDDFDVTDLDWHIPYTLKSTLVYDLGDGQETEVVSEDPFELEYKRVEIKHVDRVELFEKQADGSFALVEELSTNPSDYSRYYAKVIDDKQKDTYLSVIASEETDLDGKPYVRLTATAPQLIEYSGQGTDNQDHYQFYVPKAQTYTDGKYRDFESLITAMRANPSGTFELGDDLDATKFSLANNATSYVPENFSGKLIGNGNQIKGLTAPLFNHLNGAFEISDLALTEVNINLPSASQIGTLANTTEGVAGQSKVTNVAVEGRVVANRLVGGLVYMARNTAFENISFEGDLRTTNSWNVDISGGLVGYLRNASSINKAKVNANITVNANQNPGSFHIGMVSGSVGEGGGNFTTPITNVVATGNLVNQSATVANIGGLVGSTAGTARLSDMVSQVNVTNGEAILGKAGNAASSPTDTVVVVEGTALGNSTTAPTVSAAQAQVQVDAMGITVDVNDFIKPDVNKYDVDYSRVAGYQSGNDLKYANTEKLLPFYNKEIIVKQGNRITGGKLATVEVVSVVPMAGDQIVSDYAGQKADINKIMVYYADGTIEEMPVSYKEDFRDTAISEYTIAGGNLVYTPNQLTTNYKDVVAQVKSALAGLDYYDPAILAKLNKDVGSETVKDLMDKLYLNDSFAQVKEDLDTFLSSVLATSNVIATPNHDLGQYILDNKEELMMGLAYVNRWYNIQFGDHNLKDLFLYHQDFYGKPVDTLDWLIKLGKGGYDVINPVNNVTTFANYIGTNTGHNDLLSFLTANRELFTDFESDNDWFKATTKAHIAEVASKERPDVDVSVYSILSLASQQNGILPLLTTRGETFILTNMGGITYGMYDRYYGFNEIQALATQEEKEAYIRGMVDQAAIWQADHFDFWYRIAPADVRDRIIKPMVTWDGYQIPNGGPWLPMYGDDSRDAIRDFFGPIGSRAHFANNGAGAIANGTTIWFMFNQVLNQYGSSVYTHEAVHNNDGNIYLGGYGRRFGQRAELFAQGFLQATTNHNSTDFGINNMYDYEALGKADATDRYQALSPERFQNDDDLRDYFHGSFDVLYTLDYAEANVVLNNLSQAEQTNYFNKIENYYVQDVGTGADTHAGNTIRRFTEEEWTSLNISSVYDLIDNDVVTHREHSLANGTNSSTLNRNGYYYAQMFSPIYSALSNSKGAPGDLMFRRMAFEILAEAGYENGFIPYSSNKLADIALERGSTGTETWGGTRTVGNVTDDIVLEVVFNGQYKTWADFKKEMFRQRIAKVGSLKPVTITYNNQEITLSSYAEIESLLKEALEEDMRRFAPASIDAHTPANNRNYNSNSRVKEVKAKIYNAYLLQSDDFRESIYK